MQDGARDGEGSSVGSDADSREAPEHAEDDGEEGHEAVCDEFGVQGPQEHCDDADEGEQAYYDWGVEVGRAGEEECHDCPEICKRCGCEEGYDARLDEHWVLCEHDGDRPEGFEVV